MISRLIHGNVDTEPISTRVFADMRIFHPPFLFRMIPACLYGCHIVCSYKESRKLIFNETSAARVQIFNSKKEFRL